MRGEPVQRLGPCVGRASESAAREVEGCHALILLGLRHTYGMTAETAPGRIVLIGSGEIGPSMAPLHRSLVASLPKRSTPSSLVALDGSGFPQAQQASGADVMCRVCHTSTVRQHAREWLVCSVAGCCGGYAVCAACACALDRADAADAGSEDFPLEVRGTQAALLLHTLLRRVV